MDVKHSNVDANVDDWRLDGDTQSLLSDVNLKVSRRRPRRVVIDDEEEDSGSEYSDADDEDGVYGGVDTKYVDVVGVKKRTGTLDMLKLPMKRFTVKDLDRDYSMLLEGKHIDVIRSWKKLRKEQKRDELRHKIQHSLSKVVEQQQQQPSAFSKAKELDVTTTALDIDADIVEELDTAESERSTLTRLMRADDIAKLEMKRANRKKRRKQLQLKLTKISSPLQINALQEHRKLNAAADLKLDIEVGDRMAKIPSWMSDMTCVELRQLCRLLKVPKPSRLLKREMQRSCAEMVYNRFRRKPKDTKDSCQLLVRRGGKKFWYFRPNMEDQTRCRILNVLEITRQAVNEGYEKMWCPTAEGKLPPNWDHGNPGDCPDGFYRERLADGKLGCCIRDLDQALNIPTQAERLKSLKTIKGIDGAQRLAIDKEMREDYRQWNATKKTVSKEITTKEGMAVFVKLVGRTRSVFSQFLRSRIDTLTSDVADECDKEHIEWLKVQNKKKWSSKLQRIFGSAVGLLYGFIKYVGVHGIDLAQWIMRSPKTARMITFIALGIKQKLCRRMAIFLFQNNREATWGESADDLVGDLSEGAKVAFSKGIQNMVSSDGFRDGMKSTFVKIGGALGRGVLMAIPGASIFTEVASTVMDIASDAVTEAVQFATEVTIFKSDVDNTIKNLMDLVDPRTCLSQFTEIQNKS